MPFVGKNFDKDFEQAEKKTPQIIGRAFSQPPILRAEDVGANFGADLMRNAYDYYNSITESERQIVSRVFKSIFDLWNDPTINIEKDYDIVPKFYRVNATLAERLGANVEKVLEILGNASMNERAKSVILSTVYGIEEDEIDKLLEGMRI